MFLPFESDRLLSVILSKAFLFAGDEAITGPSIARQIGIWLADGWNRETRPSAIPA